MAAKNTDKQAAERTEQVLADGAPKTEQGIERDSRGQVAVVRMDKRVADPTSPEAVQVPANTVPASHDRQLGMEGQDDVTNDDLEQLKANQVYLGDVTAESLEVSSKSHNPVSPAMERLQAARAELDEQNDAADKGRAEAGTQESEGAREGESEGDAAGDDNS
jgi:hypothetical protein